MRVYVVTYQHRVVKPTPDSERFSHRQVWVDAKPKAFLSLASAQMFIKDRTMHNRDKQRQFRHMVVHSIPVETFPVEL